MKLSLGICLCLIFVQCKNVTEVSNEMVTVKLEEIRQNFIDAKTKECERMLMIEIEQRADSILISLSKKIKYDSLTIPYDSVRPVKPEVDFPDYKKPQKPVEELKKINKDSATDKKEKKDSLFNKL